ncbi:MAG: septum formation initiator family protein [Vicinamibacterales bacterium]|nr:septum formation initiator family protein [Vicinamibacterales bacterium]
MFSSTFMSTRQTISLLTAGRSQQRWRRAVSGLLFFVVCVLAVDALVGEQGLVATRRAQKQYDQLTFDLARLRAQNSALREEARRLREDPAAIEEIARRELGLISPGEKLFIIKDIPPPAKK